MKKQGQCSRKRSKWAWLANATPCWHLRPWGCAWIAVSTPEETTKALHRLYSEGIPVIFLTETCAQQVPETLERYKTDPKCAVIPIPGSSGANGFGLSRVKANVEKAIGADILFNNEKEGT